MISRARASDPARGDCGAAASTAAPANANATAGRYFMLRRITKRDRRESTGWRQRTGPGRVSHEYPTLVGFSRAAPELRGAMLGAYQCQKNSSSTMTQSTKRLRARLMLQPSQNAHLKPFHEITAKVSTRASQTAQKMYSRRLVSTAAWPILGSMLISPMIAAARTPAAPPASAKGGTR